MYKDIKFNYLYGLTPSYSGLIYILQYVLGLGPKALGFLIKRFIDASLSIPTQYLLVQSQQ